MPSTAILLMALAASHQLPLEQPDTTETVMEAASSCVGSLSSSPLYGPSAWQLVPDSDFPPGVVGPAMAAWNSSSCNTNGTAFPQFATSPTAGSRQVPLHYANGVNQSDPRACGQTTASGITLYSQAKMPNGTTTSCGSTNIQIQNLEHEMGHQLDLADSSCPGYIMSPAAFPPQTGPIPPQPNPRAIQPGECSEANQFNITPAEQAPPPPPPPSVCPPDCACPASCATYCDANGVCQDDGGGPGDGCDPEHPCDDGGLQGTPPPRLRGWRVLELTVNRFCG